MTVMRTLGPVTVIYRGDEEQWRTKWRMQRREEVRRWLAKTATWTKSLTWREWEQHQKRLGISMPPRTPWVSD